MAEDSIIYIGSKPVMNYVLATVTQFNAGSTKVTIKARGRAISRAVDTSEVVRNRFMTDIQVEDIKISTEEIAGEDGKNFNVSSIEILLKR